MCSSDLAVKLHPAVWVWKRSFHDFSFLALYLYFNFQVPFKLSPLYFIFTNNSDVKDLLIFGHNIDTWLIYVLIFLGLSSLAFILVWLIGLLAERQSGKSIKQPWE